MDIDLNDIARVLARIGGFKDCDAWERRILDVLDGHSNRELMHRWGLGPSGTKNALQIMRDALGVSSRGQLLQRYDDEMGTDIVGKIADAAIAAGLPPTRRPVIELVIEGHSNEAIADILGCTKPVVRDKACDCVRRLGLRGRQGFIAWYFRRFITAPCAGFGGTSVSAGAMVEA